MSRHNEFFCQVCNETLLVKGVNDLLTTYPALAKEFSKNESNKPEDFMKNSGISILWTCSVCNGEYDYKLKDREVGDDSCPYCSNRKILAGFNSLADIKLELVEEWSLNNEKAATDYFATSAFRALWKCPTFNGEYGYNIKDRDVGDDTCPYCRNTRVLAGYNTLDCTNPELAKEWGPSNEYKVTEFMSSSSARVLWFCPTCNGEYSYRINERKVGDDSCPYCSNRRVLEGYNTIDVVKTLLVGEWSPNNEFSSSSYTIASTYRALWICPTCNGEYERDYFNNYLLVDPDKILDTFNKPVWWRCNRDKSHKYMMSPKKKLYYQMRHMRSCTVCKGYRRKRQHFIRFQK